MPFSVTFLFPAKISNYRGFPSFSTPNTTLPSRKVRLFKINPSSAFYHSKPNPYLSSEKNAQSMSGIAFALFVLPALLMLLAIFLVKKSGDK
ncbi:MAG: hypothetical protein EA411_08705 [Saprospirales bacterium]|nr:MAG: hypothetical protein EA411_08705 [Saprospirales bacterium]